MASYCIARNDQSKWTRKRFFVGSLKTTRYPQYGQITVWSARRVTIFPHSTSQREGMTIASTLVVDSLLQLGCGYGWVENGVQTVHNEWKMSWKRNWDRIWIGGRRERRGDCGLKMQWKDVWVAVFWLWEKGRGSWIAFQFGVKGSFTFIMMGVGGHMQ